MSVCSRSGKARLSNTVIESSRAPPWNIMPRFLRTSYICRSDRPVISVPAPPGRPVVLVPGDDEAACLRPHQAPEEPQHGALARAAPAEDYGDFAARKTT